MRIFNKAQIEATTKDFPALMKGIEEGFMLYSQGKVVIPPVGHMHFEAPPGNLHIKYGHIPGEEFFVVKIASHFPQNPRKGFSSINGMVLLFSQKTGEPVVLFEDHGYLAHLRTGLAGAVVAKYFAPTQVASIGIVGAGTQARMQLRCLEEVLSCREVLVWARSPQEAQDYADDPILKNFHISMAKDLDELMQCCNYIITTTPSCTPLLFSSQVRPGMHITAIGADSPGKQELDPHILEKADLVIVDSRSQCSSYGETHHALAQLLLHPSNIHEIGEVIAGASSRRNLDEQITVADLTGLAVQDLKIAEDILIQYQFLLTKNNAYHGSDAKPQND